MLAGGIMRGCRVSLVWSDAEGVKGPCIVFGVWCLAFGVWRLAFRAGGVGLTSGVYPCEKGIQIGSGERQLNRRGKAPCRGNLVGSQNRSTISKTT